MNGFPRTYLSRTLSIVLFLRLLVGATSHGIGLPALFSDHMVLQCNQPVPVWGWADPGESVTVTFAGMTKSTTTNAAGQWMVRLDPLESAQTGELVIRASQTITLTDVIVGEVWLASGQSNMHANLTARHPDRERVLDESDDPWVRQFTVERDVKHPARQLSGVWRKANRANLTASRTDGDSSVAYFFSRQIRTKLNRPVGVVHASVGATSIQSWSPGGRLFQTMIEPCAPFGIRGAIWYQGESDLERGKTAEYADLLQRHVSAWRNLWNQGDFPFLFVQLAPFQYSKKTVGPLKDAPVDPFELPRFWEIQSALRQSIPSAGLAVIHDSVPPTEIDNIHPLNKKIPGERLAALALAKVYEQTSTPCEGPFYRSMTVEGQSIRVHFSGAQGGLATRDGCAPDLFEIAGADLQYVPGSARIEDETVVVQSPLVPRPVAVRFGWHETARPNLMNCQGLPAFPFRSDRPNTP